MRIFLKEALNFDDLPKGERFLGSIFILFIFVFPFIIHSHFAQAVMINFLLFSIWGMGWNAIGGFGGQVSLGAAQYIGIGSYTTAMLLVLANIPFWISTPIGMIIAMTWSFILGYPLFRLSGHYFAIATISITLVLQTIFTNWQFVFAARGIQIPFKTMPNWLYLQFTDDVPYHYTISILFLLCFLFMNWFRRSKLGYQLRAIKANEDAAESLGIDIRLAKTKAYAICAAFVALGGSFYAVYNMYIDPMSVFEMMLSITIALIAILGGAGSFWGPIIGAAILVPLDRYLGVWFGASGGRIGMDFIIYAVLIMIIASIEPKGIWGLIKRGKR